MEIEDYYLILTQFAEEIQQEEISAHDFLENKIGIDRQFMDILIEFRKDFISDAERERVKPLLFMGHFGTYEGIERDTCFTISLEIEQEGQKIGWYKRCETYRISQPIFEAEPGLFDFIRRTDTGSTDNELISLAALKRIGRSEAVSFGTHFFKMDDYLKPQAVTWSNNEYPDSPLFIRLKPYEAYKNRPFEKLFEATLIPANPHWWKKLTIHDRTREGASYLLEDCSPGENRQQYWEYKVKGVKRLDIIAVRDNAGNLSMMLEELAQKDKDGVLLGRCIHLDTNHPFGGKFEDAVLNHLDLAINIYEGEDIKRRMAGNLAFGGKTTDATCRTHLLRINHAPFTSLFGFVHYFFESVILTQEWITEQFGDAAKAWSVVE